MWITWIWTLNAGAGSSWRFGPGKLLWDQCGFKGRGFLWRDEKATITSGGWLQVKKNHILLTPRGEITVSTQFFILVAVLCSKQLAFHPQTDALNKSVKVELEYSNRRDSALLQTDQHQYPECTRRADICHTGDLWKSPSPPSAASHWSYRWHSEVLITTFNLSSRRLGFDETCRWCWQWRESLPAV